MDGGRWKFNITHMAGAEDMLDFDMQRRMALDKKEWKRKIYLDKSGNIRTNISPLHIVFWSLYMVVHC